MTYDGDRHLQEFDDEEEETTMEEDPNHPSSTEELRRGTTI